ncbi:hypothetical protein AHMF7616_02421 [Adhaeribacter pallidiroseus]|uniref:Uncharacterized protein n=1 Tax=Adhaeribacter pallidiroseus TaxID=2072847 RepID=A0A369QHA1_9BACT|nr:hypothetical protein AHMF7616_02421 [Adhaeribacter pallidiroseus]
MDHPYYSDFKKIITGLVNRNKLVNIYLIKFKHGLIFLTHNLSGPALLTLTINLIILFNLTQRLPHPHGYQRIRTVRTIA